MNTADLIVIGAGPAGMNAATQAATLGLSVLLLDEQPAAGGQIYRAVAGAGPERLAILGADYLAGRPMVAALSHKNIRHETRVSVWRVDPDAVVTYSRDGIARQARGRQIILATGAIERAVALPGWTQPGVMTVGAAQILLKADGMVASDAVLVGSGPLLYLVACQMIAAGVAPTALVETRDTSNLAAAMRHVGRAIRGWRAIASGLELLRRIRRAGVPRHRSARDISIDGPEGAKRVHFTSKGRSHQIACKSVLLHQGVVPNTQISRSLGLAHKWDARQRCFCPETDRWGGTAIATIAIAGDGAGIGGAKAAATMGRIAAIGAAQRLGIVTDVQAGEMASGLFTALRRERVVRPFLDALYAPPGDIRCPDDATIICRCEEVTAGDIRAHVAAGCVGPNQAKAFGRAGMGPCQGRNCGLLVSEIIADQTGKSLDEVGYFRIRSPIKPVTLGELAGIGALENRRKKRH